MGPKLANYCETTRGPSLRYGCNNDEFSIRAKNAPALREQPDRIMHMLDDVAGNNGIERLIWKVLFFKAAKMDG